MVKEWMLQVGPEFWRGEMYKVPKRWQKYTDMGSSYVEHY